jgi:hypothetical protein
VRSRLQAGRRVSAFPSARWNGSPIWSGFNPIQVNLTECHLSDIAENAVSFFYQPLRLSINTLKASATY